MKRNKYKLEDYLRKTFEGCESTFKETSYDGINCQYLCSDEKTEPVFDFDKYVKKRYDSSHLPASPDAIYIGPKALYFVEFKNQKPKDIDKTQLRRKFEKGTEILKNMLQSFQARDVQFFFCVVYRDEAISSFGSYQRGILGWSFKHELEELNQAHNSYYDGVYVNNLSFYMQEFKDLRCY